MRNSEILGFGSAPYDPNAKIDKIIAQVDEYGKQLPDMLVLLDKAIGQGSLAVLASQKALTQRPEDVAFIQKDLALARRAMGWLKQVRKRVEAINQMFTTRGNLNVQ